MDNITNTGTVQNESPSLNNVEEVYQTYKKKSQFKEFWRRFKKSKTALMGLIPLVSLLVVTLIVSLTIPCQMALDQNVMIKLQRPSGEHWFGTDNYGRDIFSRIFHGAKYSLLIGLAAVGMGM